MVSHTQTITELGGVPSEATKLSLLLNADSEQDQRPPSPPRDARIASVSVTESRALPQPREINNPPNWPTIRGTPDYVPREREIDFADRPLGANNGEFIFLIFMLSGVQVVTVSLRFIRICSW